MALPNSGYLDIGMIYAEAQYAGYTGAKTLAALRDWGRWYPAVPATPSDVFISDFYSRVAFGDFKCEVALVSSFDVNPGTVLDQIGLEIRYTNGTSDFLGGQIFDNNDNAVSSLDLASPGTRGSALMMLPNLTLTIDWVRIYNLKFTNQLASPVNSIVQFFDSAGGYTVDTADKGFELQDTVPQNTFRQSPETQFTGSFQSQEAVVARLEFDNTF